MAYVVIARWLAAPGNEERAGQVLAELAVPSNAEPGCRTYRPVQSLDDPRAFLIYEEYDDEAAYEAHTSSEHFRRLAVEQGIPMLASRERAFSRTV